MRDDGIEVSRLNWGTGNPSGTTDASLIKLIDLPNADLLIVQQDMGPETQACYGSFDYEHSLQIAFVDRAQFTAMLLSIAFEGTSPCGWEDLKSHCHNWSVPFRENGKATS